ncbi:hypothetical protein BVX97_00635, partial [bacterium E08(2017)]
MLQNIKFIICKRGTPMFNGCKKAVLGAAVMIMLAISAQGQATLPVADSYEPDNDYLNATTPEVAVAQLHTLFPANDQDWYTFVPETGHVYRIETSVGPNYSNGIDTVIELWNYDVSTQLDQNDDAFSFNFFSRIDYTATSTNALNIKVEMSLPTEVGDYYLEITDLTSSGGTGGVTAVDYPPFSTVGLASNTAIAMDNDGRPVVAYSYADTNGISQVYLIRWNDDIFGLLGNWTALLGRWASADGSFGIVDQLSNVSGYARNPSIATFNDNIYVAWENQQVTSEYANIYLARYTPAGWAEVGGSMSGYG